MIRNSLGPSSFLAFDIKDKTNVNIVFQSQLLWSTQSLTSPHRTMLLYTWSKVLSIGIQKFRKLAWYKVCYFTFSKKFRSSNEELDIECHHGQGVLLCGSNLTIYQIRGVLVQVSLFGNLRALPIAVHEVAVEANTRVIELPRSNFQPGNNQWKRGRLWKMWSLGCFTLSKDYFPWGGCTVADQVSKWHWRELSETVEGKSDEEKQTDPKSARLSWVYLNLVEFCWV